MPPQEIPPPSDRGIGGTGMIFDPGEDRGIGGTGVIGTIRGFGSIVVNDLHIDYGRDTSVALDGRPIARSSLAIGQVVRVLAQSHPRGLFTRHIELLSEVVGRVSAVRDGSLMVLGQTVLVPAGRLATRWRVGQRVSVSGLRQPDGVILASLIMPARGGSSRVMGQVSRDERDTGFRIGSLEIGIVDADLEGKRVVVVGHEGARRFKLRHLETEADVLARVTARSFLFEALVQRAPEGVMVGSGVPVDAKALSDAPVPDEGLFRALVSTRRDLDGTYAVQSVVVSGRLDSRGNNRGSHDGPGTVGGTPGQGPGQGDAGIRNPGHGPGDGPGFGPGGAGPGGMGPGGAGPGGAGPGGMGPGNGGPSGAAGPGTEGGGFGGPGGGMGGPGPDGRGVR